MCKECNFLSVLKLTALSALVKFLNYFSTGVGNFLPTWATSRPSKVPASPINAELRSIPNLRQNSVEVLVKTKKRSSSKFEVVFGQTIGKDPPKKSS